MLTVESSLGVASGGAERRVEGPLVEETHSVVGVVVLAVLLDVRSEDGSLEVLRSVKLLNSGCGLAGGCKLGVTFDMLVMSFSS